MMQPSDVIISQIFFKQNSITTVMQKFIDEFLFCRQEMSLSERRIADSAINQLFRRYYYSSLHPDANLSPAMIINHLLEAELGPGFIALPFISLEKKTAKAPYAGIKLRVYSSDSNPYIFDMDKFLSMSENGYALDHGNIRQPLESEVMIRTIGYGDSHYVRILNLLAQKAGLCELQSDKLPLTVKITPEVEKYMSRTHAEKLSVLAKALTGILSDELCAAYPDMKGYFNPQSLLRLFKDPEYYLDFEDPLLRKLEEQYGTDYFDILEQKISMGIAQDEEVAAATKALDFSRICDEFFIAPAGFDMQLIQPIYFDCFNMFEELSEISFAKHDNVDPLRNLFFAADEYDLTFIGGQLADKGRTHEKQQEIPGGLTDRQLLELIKEAEALRAEFDAPDED